MPLQYQSGEEIRKGDRILIAGLPGEVEFVVDPTAPTPETTWYIKEHGSGVMIKEATVFGAVFTGESDDELEFVSRGN